MSYLTSHNVIASVRRDGAIGEFAKRVFHLMLHDYSTPDQQQLEAIRIIRQLGYETRGVEIIYAIEEDIENE